MPKVRVSSIPPKGFRRIGQQFTREPREIDVTAKELTELQDEPNLVVVEVPAGAPEKDDKKDKK